MPPRISVLMSVYNGERYLRAAVDSILAQTFTDFEFLIIDDGSTDGTGALLADYATRDPRVQVIVQAVNQGLTTSLNVGLRLARGEYVARMDADDVSLPERFEHQTAFLDRHPEVGVVGGGFQVIDALGRPIPPIYEHPTQPGFVAWSLYFYNPIAHPTVMMRRANVLRVGGYDPAVPRSQDHDLWCRLSGQVQLANLSCPLTFLRKHDGNVSAREYEVSLACSVRAVQGLISRSLGRPVRETVVRNLYTGRSATPHDAYEVAAMIRALAQTTLRQRLEPEARRLIRENAIARLGQLALHSLGGPWSWRRWRVRAWAWALARLN